MRFSEAWLREHVNPPVDTARLVEQLTMAGLEVDAVEPAAPPFSGVVIAEVVAVAPHPDADRLKVCRVSIGRGEPLQIVCGAPNVRTGMKAPLATIGAVLPGGFKIRKSKLRGVESFGMLCSAKELGLAEAAEGLWALPADAPVGEDLRDWLQLDDQVIEVDLTPNRADCLSVEGISREVAVLNRIDWRPRAVEPVPAQHQDVLPVEVAAEVQAACPRYLGRLIEGIDPQAPTPMWMQERLRRSGLRSLGAVVDITNYVLLELGQPLHAFDAARIEDGIRVRQARAGEKLALLNDQEITLTGDELVIADARYPLALAGIMGGRDSAVSDGSADIFLECAFFAPEAIMGKARRHGLHTDSSHRFERGVDPQLQPRAIEYATRLIMEIAGGKPGPVVETLATEHLPQRTPIRLRRRRISRLLGRDFEAAEVQEILQRLGMEIASVAEDEWQVTAPSCRFDINIEADLIEELARIAGYQNLPVRAPRLPMTLRPVPEGRLPLARVRALLGDRDYREAITYSFVDRTLQETLAPDLAPVVLANPLSADMAVMRTTLWTGLLQALRHNLNRQQNRVRLFEAGLRFCREGETIRQEKMLAGIACGPVWPEQWGAKTRPLDFYDLKGDVEALLAATGRRDFAFEARRHPALHPGQSAALIETATGQVGGWLGMLHPQIAETLGIETNVFLFEMAQAVLEERKVPALRPLSRFPSVRRDLAVVVGEDVPAGAVVAAVREAAGEWLVDVVLFDVYRGAGLEAGEKSLALGLVLQHPECTLTDEEVDRTVTRVVETLRQRFAAKLRS
ncbi:phenylalanyl-tRNA synthetase beta chain [Methylomarinovum caldicuralii]|uniref:Phenylalanine--tRNA ligase beta subunit n=1 Tax=Methylomarinovum caldicuralii TaxID=438856 RepID=A0AAU9C2R6_9GAMM|nr:phenylalanine--tRNA ligase subunit beta [Methylomarinovum caldicuralii]BCX82697.1 phenylalanyl-tRNA synthetase beta chain [Methylomarinovum caldicuralii]